MVWCPPEAECLPVFYHALKLWKWQQKFDTWKPEPKPLPTAYLSAVRRGRTRLVDRQASRYNRCSIFVSRM